MPAGLRSAVNANLPDADWDALMKRVNSGKAPPKAGAGMDLWKAAEFWTGGGSNVSWKLGERDALANGEAQLRSSKTPTIHSRPLAAILEAYSRSKPPTEVSRGIYLSSSGEKPETVARYQKLLAAAQPGQQITMPLSSWSADPGFGSRWAGEMSADPEATSPIVFTMKEPMRALDINAMSGKYKNVQHEAVTGGRFNVVSRENRDGVEYIELEQVDPFDFGGI